jgi:hypothetical protein
MKGRWREREKEEGKIKNIYEYKGCEAGKRRRNIRKRNKYIYREL